MKPETYLDRPSSAPAPVAVVDIGSNTVRLVIYDGLRRAPSPMFNEKVACGLGKGVAINGRLSDAAMARALGALRRFRAIIRQVRAGVVFAVATAAARDADNGAEFIAAARKELGSDIAILTGKQEARYAAFGVMSAVPGADGIVGDLGGGSLELIDVSKGKVRQGITLPLGALRILDTAGRDHATARQFVDEQLDRVGFLPQFAGRAFYAVGGSWRNLARLHMAQTGYPLSVIHHYTLDHDTARSLADFVSHLSVSTLRGVETVSKTRLETLPVAALVLERLLARARPAEVVTSVFGVREGLLFSRLGKRARDSDPLLTACWDFARRYARSPEHELELCSWTGQLFAERGLAETLEERRLRYAACMLADISWRANPDYRSGRALTMISQASFVGVDHPGRVFLALTVFFRYQGVNAKDAPRALVELMPEDWLDRARIIAGAMRLAYVLTAAMTGLLPKIGLEVAPERKLVLRLTGKQRNLMGEAIHKRLEQLAQLLGLDPVVELD